MKKLLVLLFAVSLVLMGCASKETCVKEETPCATEKAEHVCTAECDHSADAKAEKAHECSGECGDDCTHKAEHAEEGHVCTEACGEDCPHKAEAPVEEAEAGEETEGEEGKQ